MTGTYTIKIDKSGDMYAAMILYNGVEIYTTSYYKTARYALKAAGNYIARL